jgi:phenylacetate-CoA ligase
LYRFVARHILAPGLDFLRGTQSMKLLQELEESQWWSRDKILDLQNQRLKLLINYAYYNVRYYRNIFDKRGLKPGDIECSFDLVKLPILTKHLIRNNFDEITSESFPVKERVRLATGGSTGQPLEFYNTWYDNTDLTIAAVQRANSCIGFEFGDRNAGIRSRQIHQTKAGNFWHTPIKFFRRTLSIDASEEPEEIVRKLEHFQPKFIKGYPSVLEQLARVIQIKGKERIGAEALITGAEQLHNHQRVLFKETFGCDTYSTYGSHEIHLIAFECKEHSGYHIAAENVIVEIVDDNGITMPAGQEGRILITNLHNYVMPFIRYDIGDLGVISDENCPCGRGLPILKSINGRNVDAIKTKSKGIIPGIRLWEPFNLLAHLGVQQFQVVQNTDDKIVIKLVLDKDYSSEYMDVISKRAMAEYKPILGEDMAVSIEFVNQIPLSPAGKRIAVVSNLQT